MKQDGKSAFGHVVANHEVAIGRAEISAETGAASVERAIRIRRLGSGAVKLALRFKQNRRSDGSSQVN
jgi:hypothetical protein